MKWRSWIIKFTLKLTSKYILGEQKRTDSSDTRLAISALTSLNKASACLRASSSDFARACSCKLKTNNVSNSAVLDKVVYDTRKFA